MTTFAAWPQELMRISPTEKFRFSTTTGLNLSGLNGGSATATSEIENTAMVKVVTGSGTNSEIRYTTTWSNSRQAQGLRFYVPDYTKLSNLLFYSGSAGFSPNFGNFTYSFASSDKQYNGWHYVDLFPGGWSVGAGAGFTSSVADWKVRVNPAAATVGTVYLHSLEVEQMQRPQVLLTYDDGEESAWTDTYGIQYANSLGLKATCGITGSLIDSDARWMTSAHLAAIYAAGNDLCAHGETSLATLTASQIEDDIAENIGFLRDRGYTRGLRQYIYPNGAYQISAGDMTIINALRAAGVVCARTTARQVTYAPKLISDRMMQIPIVGWLATDTPAGMLTQVDNAIRRGHTAVLMFHAIVAAGASGTEINSADHKTILDGLASRVQQGLIDCPSWSNWYRGLTQPQTVA